MNLVQPGAQKLVEAPISVNNKRRHAFLLSYVLILCRLPSKNDPEKLYKAYRRLDVSTMAYADFKGTSSLEIQAGKNSKPYTLTFRTPAGKSDWIRIFSQLKVPVVEAKKPLAAEPPAVPSRGSTPARENVTARRQLSNPGTSAHKKERKVPTKTVSSPNVEERKSTTDQDVKIAVEGLLSKLKKELTEETQTRIIAEEQNRVMEGILKEQNKEDSANMLDESSLNELEERAESLSTMVDKLTQENFDLANQAETLKAELIRLREANGQSVDDLLRDLDEDRSEDSELEEG